MADVGVQSNFVDTQDSKLTNFTDSLTYTQLTDLEPDIDSNVTKHQLTNDTIDNVFSLRMNSLQGNMSTVTAREGVRIIIEEEGTIEEKLEQTLYQCRSLWNAISPTLDLEVPDEDRYK